MRLPRRRRTHPGIELEIRTPAGPLLRADSDQLYLSARFGGGAEGLELLGGLSPAGRPWPRVIIRPRRLPAER